MAVECAGAVTRVAPAATAALVLSLRSTGTALCPHAAVVYAIHVHVPVHACEFECVCISLSVNVREKKTERERKRDTECMYLS